SPSASAPLVIQRCRHYPPDDSQTLPSPPCLPLRTDAMRPPPPATSIFGEMPDCLAGYPSPRRNSASLLWSKIKDRLQRRRLDFQRPTKGRAQFSKIQNRP